MRFVKGRFLDFWYLHGTGDTRAKQTVEYWMNGRKPLTWGFYDDQ